MRERAWLAMVVWSLAGCGDAGGTGAFTGDGDAGGPPGDGGESAAGGAGLGPSCEPDSDLRRGEGTYYDADGSGNCSFPASPDDLMVAAMNHDDYAASAACGACVAITGPNGSVEVRIVDQCPGCPAGDIDLSPQAFERIAPLDLGRVPISWRYVSCDVSGPIVYHYKEGSNPFWTAVQIRNHATPIATVEAMDGSGQFAALPRADYNFFIADSGLGEGPYTFRVTDTEGQVLEDSGVGFVEAGDVPGVSQFDGCGM